ncbi:MAG: Gfo/Idh/MocA family oxidoreductase [Spirochaetia bacterium]|nr:Gfo/Idh/MocA family oxidoreductase [Spirochaetia bacterium]
MNSLLWNNKEEQYIGNASYSRTKVYNEVFEYLSAEDKYILASPEKKFKLAFIGVGLMGQGHIYSTFVEGRAYAAGIYDPHLKSVEAAVKLCRKLYGADAKPKIYQNIDEALKDKEIDGYIISSPNYTHTSILDSFLKSGKPIYMEKPMATTVEDAAHMVKAVEKAGSKVQVGLQYRFKPIYVEAIKEALHAGSLGDVKTIAIREHRYPFLDKVNQWNKFDKYSGGTLVEKCCHYFDLFNLFSQSRPKRVYAAGSQAASYKNFIYKDEKSDILDNANVFVTYENGIHASFDLCMFVPLFFEELVLCGSGGRLRTFEQEEDIGQGQRLSGFELFRGERHPVIKSSPHYQGVISTLGHSGADYFSKAAFVDLLEGNDENSPTVEEGYWSVVVGAAAQESVRTGVPVEVETFIKTRKAEI